MNDINWLISEIKLHINAFGEFDLGDLEELEKQVKQDRDAYLESIKNLYTLCEDIEKETNLLVEEIKQFGEKIDEFNKTLNISE